MAQPKKTGPTTLDEVAAALTERDVAMTLHIVGDTFVVWLVAMDDPALGAFVGESFDLPAAVQQALDSWDQCEVAAEAEEHVADPEPTN